MAKKHHPSHIKQEPNNTVTPADVILTDSELEILGNVVLHWNVSKKPEDPPFDARSALARLARLSLQSLANDYADPPTTEPPPLDTPGKPD